MPEQTSRLFRLPPQQRGAAQSWIEHGERTPVKPRLASSVVLLRDSPTGTQTYLAYRGGESPLGPVAFPGGSVQAADDDAFLWFGPSALQWAAALGIADHQRARRHIVAAIRELFEETGILLAGQDATTLVEHSSNPDWMRAREAIASEEKSFAEVLGRRGLGLRTDLLKPLSHWISPDFVHRRFDTRYFAAAQPVNQHATLLQSKGVWGRWKCAAEEVARRDTTGLGDEVDQPNTRGLTLSEITVPAVEITLEKIASSRGCVAYLSHKRPVRCFQPALVQSGEEYLLQVEAAAATEGGSSQRGR